MFCSLGPPGRGPAGGRPGSGPACRRAGGIWAHSGPWRQPAPSGVCLRRAIWSIIGGRQASDHPAAGRPETPLRRHHRGCSMNRLCPVPEALPAGRLPAGPRRRRRPGDRPGGPAAGGPALEPGDPGAADPHPGGRDQGPLRSQGPDPADGSQGGPGRLGRHLLRPGPGPGPGGPRAERHDHGPGHGHGAGPGAHRPGPDGLHGRGRGALRGPARGFQPRRRRADREPGPHLQPGRDGHRGGDLHRQPGGRVLRLGQPTAASP